MSKNINELLSQYAAEAGEAGVDPSAPNEALQEALVDETAVQGTERVSEIVDDAERSGDIAEQLDDLADRAEGLEKTAEQAESEMDRKMVDVSTEGLVREYNTTLRAYGLTDTWGAYSPEAAETTDNKLSKLKRDARVQADISRKVAKDLGDLSTEASGIVKTLMSHKARLIKARAGLDTASKKLSANIAELKAEPQVVKHDGVRRFMIQHGKPVENLPAALSEEIKWMGHAHAAVQSAYRALGEAATKLAANKDATLDQVISKSALSAIQGLTTAPGALMGNNSVVIAKEGELVPKYVRKNPMNVTAGQGAVAAVKGVLSGVGHGLGTAIPLALLFGGLATGGLLVPGSAVAGALSGAAAMGIRGAALYGAGKGALDSVNASKLKSAAGAADLLKCVNEVLGYTQYTDDPAKVSHIYDTLDEVKDPGKVWHEINNALWNVSVLEEILYDQAVYTTLRMAVIAEQVV